MALAHEIKCVETSRRPAPHERITAIGGINSNGSHWRLTHAHAIICIEAGVHRFYIKVGEQIVDVIIAVSPLGNKYLKTVSDSDQFNNLLSLCECPRPPKCSGK